MLKYNISGVTNYFRIEEMSVVSVHVFAPFGDQKKGGLALFARQKIVYKGSHNDPTLPTLKSLRNESAEAKARSAAERKSRISRERDSESAKKLRPMSEVKKRMNPDEEFFMSVPAFEDSHAENPTSEEKRQYIARLQRPNCIWLRSSRSVDPTSGTN